MATESGLELTLQSAAAQITCALEIDFSDEKYLFVDVSQLPAYASLQGSVKPTGTSQSPQTIISQSAGGQSLQDINLYENINEKTAWSDHKDFELIITLSGVVGDTVILSRADILPTPAEAPETVSPLSGWDITDFAVCFSWKRVADIADYQVEVSRDEQFSSSTIYDITLTGELCSYHTIELLGEGLWYWRVRAVDSGLDGFWSQPIEFAVNDYHAKTAPQRVIDAENPLFTLEASKVPDLAPFADSIPEDLRPHTAIVSGTNYFVYKKTPLEHYAPVAEQDNNHLIRTHGPGNMGWAMSLTDVEWLFKNYPNILGICTGENFWNYWQWENDGTREYKSRLIKLCAKYGKVYIWGDGNGTTFKWQQFASNDYWLDFTAEYGEYMVCGLKNNVNHTMHTSQGALMGMWLSGMVANMSSWSECWYWNDAGFAGLDEYLGPKMGYIEDFPRNFYNVSFMHGIAQGAAVFNVDGQGTTGSIKASIWDNSGQTTETFTDYVVPFIRGVVNHNLVPGKEDVLANVKVAIAQPDRFENTPHDGNYDIYQALYDQTYGFRQDGQWYEYFPNTGKYYYFPLLPYGVNSLGSGIHIESINDLSNPAYVQSVFDTHYEKPYNSAAMHSVVGNSVFIQSTHENLSTVENYYITTDNPNIKQIHGNVGPHKYIMGKFEQQGTQFWMQANTEYWQHTTEIVFDCLWKPAVTASPQDALMQSTWSEELGEYTFMITHLFGAAEITLDSTDINGDGEVDFYDIFTLADLWLSEGDELIGDFNADGTINYFDFTVLGRRLR
jgi:hypothetical protein